MTTISRKQKRTKQTITFIVLYGLLISCMFPFQRVKAKDVDPYELNSVTTEDESILNKMKESSIKHCRLLEYYKNNSEEKESNSEKHTYSGLYSYQYPEEYAGAYIGSTGELVILIKNGHEEYVEKICTILESDGFLYRFVPNSYSFLLNTMEQISLFLGNQAYDFRFSRVCVNDYDNSVDVYFQDISDDIIKSFQEHVCDEEVIHYYIEDSPIIDQTSIPAGSLIFRISNGTFTAGFRCKRTNESGSTDIGFVTANHAVLLGADIYYSNFALVGEVTACNDVYDVAFVKITNSNYEGSNSIAATGKSLLSTTLSSITQGMAIYKYGKSSNETSGTIHASSVNYTSSGITHFDAFSSTYSSESGDSGGVVYAYYSSQYQALAGMHCASSSSYSYASKASNILYALGLSRY